MRPVVAVQAERVQEGTAFARHIPGVRAISPPISGVVTGLVVTGLIVVGGLTRTGYGLWAWRASAQGARLFEGIPIVWEWLDVANGVWFLESDPRWTAAHYALRTDQIIRFVPDVFIALLGAWTGSALGAAIVATWLCWFAAAAATYALCRALLPAHGHRAGCIASILVALSPGFTAYMGNVEARPFAYAAAALALLALECVRRWRFAIAAGGSVSAPDKRSAPLLVALLLFLANATLELGPPLLAMLWLFYVLLDPGAARPPRICRVRWAALVTLGYVALDAGWLALAHVATFGRITVSTDNDAWYHVRNVLTSPTLDWQAVAARLWGLESDAVRTFTMPVMLLLLPGVLVLPRRALLWTAAWLGTIVVAILLTRVWPRTLYLAYPGVYVAAAAVIDCAGRQLAGWCPRWTGTGAAAWRRAAGWAPAVVLLAVVGGLVFADLRGDPTLPRVWWPT
jgi:hypothetical protein